MVIVGRAVGHVWPKKGKFRAKTGVGHWVGHMDNESGVGRVVCTKRQLFGKTNKNTNYLSAVGSGMKEHVVPHIQN